jgi:hypothetical protein
MVGLEDVNGAGCSAAGDGVDEDECFTPVEQVIGQVHAPDAVVHQLDSRTGESMRDMTHHLGTETVVAEEDVTDPSYQNSRRDPTSLTVTSGASSCTGARPEG